MPGLHKSIPGVMTDFRIDELSGVTKGAQPGATVRLMKHDDSHQPQEHGTMLKELAKALGLSDTATEAEITKAVTDAVAKNAETATALAAAQAATAAAVAKAGLTNEERDYIKAAGLDEAAEAAFIAKSAKDRGTEITKFASADEVFTSGETTIRKSVVGAEAFNFMKRQQEQFDAQQAEIIKVQKATETATLTKVATEEYPHLAGSVEDRVAVLRHLGKADEKTRAAAEAILKAAEASTKAAFSKAGTSGGIDPTSVDARTAKSTFEAKVNEVQKRDRVTRSAAMSKAASEFPAEFEAFQAATSVRTGN